jgi:uncharacterized protein (TIGR01777 family)
MRVLISGASGLVGRKLSGALRDGGHTVARLVRPGGMVSADDVRWDPMAASIDLSALEGTDVVVHLSGASIADGRWTPERKSILRSSRVDLTRFLVDALTHLRSKPSVLVSASAIGFYGNRGDEILTEVSEGGHDFLALLARDWEAEALRAQTSGIRTVLLRFGIILSRDGGALPRMLMPFKFGAGGRIGSGRQWMSWIALEDAVDIARSVIVNEEFSGPLNVVAPNPVRNSQFARAVGAVLRRPAIFPAPEFVLRIALGEMAEPLLFASQRVRPEHLLAMAYPFRYGSLETALDAILGHKN